MRYGVEICKRTAKVGLYNSKALKSMLINMFGEDCLYISTMHFSLAVAGYIIYFNIFLLWFELLYMFISRNAYIYKTTDIVPMNRSIVYSICKMIRTSSLLYFSLIVIFFANYTLYKLYSG